MKQNSKPGADSTRVPDQTRFTSGDDLVKRLLELADDGPEIPADGAANLKELLREPWQREVRRRARRAWLWQGGIAVAVTAVIALTLANWLHTERPAPAAPVATVLELNGELEVETVDGEMHRLLSAAEISAGSWLRCDSSSRALLSMADGHQLRLDTGTWIRIESGRRLHLGHGAVYVDSDGAPGQSIELVTDVGTVRDIGTRFELRREAGGLIVRVRDGRVELDGGRRHHEVAGGHELRLAPDGSSQMREIRADAPEWAWTSQIAPRFELEGATVLSFMRWVTRESGHELRFATPEIEALAASTVVHGELGDVVPAAAPELVLPSCGLRARVVAGAMIVQSVNTNGS